MINHAKVSGIASDGDATKVQGPDWDDDHTITDAVAVKTALGLATVASSGSAADLSAGILPEARMPNLTGDVTTSEGAVATTIANDAVTYAKIQNVSTTSRILGRITSGAGDIEELTASQVASLIGLPSSLINAGDGSDGPISLTGSMGPLTADAYWTTATVAGGGATVDTGGFRVFMKILDATLGTVTFKHNGAAAAGATGGAGFSNAGTLRANSGTGATGIGNGGQSGSAPGGGNWPNASASRGGLGGAGGNGGGGSGGNAGAAPTVASAVSGTINDFTHWKEAQIDFASSTRLAGGSGGGSGAGSGTPTFSNGGGGGAGGGNCVVVCGSIIIPANVTIQALGGAAAAGTATDAGGGGGGGGGYALG
jgi:hypothetical protein